jgi:hypothetical protein
VQIRDAVCLACCLKERWFIYNNDKLLESTSTWLAVQGILLLVAADLLAWIVDVHEVPVNIFIVSRAGPLGYAGVAMIAFFAIKTWAGLMLGFLGMGNQKARQLYLLMILDRDAQLDRLRTFLPPLPLPTLSPPPLTIRRTVTIHNWTINGQQVGTVA